MGAIVLITQNFDPAQNWMDKMQLSEIFTGKKLGFRDYFILKRSRFLTTAIFIGSASTIQN